MSFATRYWLKASGFIKYSSNHLPPQIAFGFVRKWGQAVSIPSLLCNAWSFYYTCNAELMTPICFNQNFPVECIFKPFDFEILFNGVKHRTLLDWFIRIRSSNVGHRLDIKQA